MQKVKDPFSFNQGSPRFPLLKNQINILLPSLQQVKGSCFLDFGSQGFTLVKKPKHLTA